MNDAGNAELFGNEKVAALISATIDIADELGCNLLEMAHACRCLSVACLVMAGQEAREIQEEKEGNANEMLVVQQEDVLD